MALERMQSQALQLHLYSDRENGLMVIGSAESLKAVGAKLVACDAFLLLSVLAAVGVITIARWALRHAL
jgi:hypothetical protein